MKRMIYLFLILSVSMFSSLPASGKSGSDKFTIPELHEMHKVIHPMWHDAYPKKDVAMLKSLYPDIEKYFKKLEKASLPENIKDRTKHWNEKITQLKNAVNAYHTAIETSDDAALLIAARDLHTAFEGLVNIVNPPIPEMAEFHRVLYAVFHDYLPNEKWGELNRAIYQFEEKMEILQKAQLPKRMSDKAEEFNKARENLSRAVADLAKLKESDNTVRVKEAVMKVHDAYQDLEKIIE